jgi:hypothetical protein
MKTFFQNIISRLKTAYLTKLPITRPIAFILFLILWISGELSGLLAWILFLLIIDISFDIKRN